MSLKRSCKEDLWVRVKSKTTNHNQHRHDIYLTSIDYTFTTTFISFSNVNQTNKRDNSHHNLNHISADQINNYHQTLLHYH